MEIKTLGPNQRELTLRDGTKILFSYDTPVAAYLPPAAGKLEGHYQTGSYYSKTTTRHIHGWMQSRGVVAPGILPAAELAEIVKGAA